MPGTARESIFRRVRFKIGATAARVHEHFIARNQPVAFPFRSRTNHLCRNLRAFQQASRRMRQHNSYRRCGCMRPSRLPYAHMQNQRGARLRVRFLLEDNQNRRCRFHRPPETKPHLQWNVTHHLRRRVAKIQSDHAETAALYQQIGRAQRLIHIPAAHPQQIFQFHAGRFRRCRIECVARIDQRTHLRSRRARRQRRNQHAGPPRTRRPVNFRQTASRKSSRKNIHGADSRRNRFHQRSIAIFKRACDPRR